MLLHDLLGAQLRRFRHRDLVVKPGSSDHPGDAILFGAGSAPDHIAHRIDHPDPEPGGTVGPDLHRLLGNEFRL